MRGDTSVGLTLNRHFFETLARDAIVGILAFEENGRKCVYRNILAGEILELQEADTSTLRLANLFPSENVRGDFRPFSEAIVGREGLTQDVLMRRADGGLFIANIGIRHIHVDGVGDSSDADRSVAGNVGDGSILLLMFQDITFQKKLKRELTLKQEEIRQAYMDLLEQNRRLKELDNAKDKFIALTTHELRTPLSAIVATADVLQLRLYESPEQMKDFINTVYEQAHQLMELVNDVLDFSKIRAGKMEFYVEQIDVRPVLEKAISGFSNMAEKEGIMMEIDSSSAETLCYFDLLRFQEVINNVISNAIKYNRKDGRVRVSLSQVNGFTRVSVADSGQGIPEEKLPAVFNEFETVGNVSRHHKGTGLGMPISKRLMEAMGGALSLTSEVGVGTTFFIDLPNAKVLPEEFYRSRPDIGFDYAS